MTGRLALACVALVVSGCADDGRNIRSFRAPAPTPTASDCLTTATGDASVSVRLDPSGLTVTPPRVHGATVAFVVRNSTTAGGELRVVHEDSGVTALSLRVPVGAVCAVSAALGPGGYVLSSGSGAGGRSVTLLVLAP